MSEIVKSLRRAAYVMFKDGFLSNDLAEKAAREIECLLRDRDLWRKRAEANPSPEPNLRASILEDAARIADEHAAADMHLRDKAKEAKDATGVFVHAAEAATGKSIAAAIRARVTNHGSKSDLHPEYVTTAGDA